MEITSKAYLSLSKIGATALGAYHEAKGRKKSFNIVLCPSHLTKKWAREIEETLPGVIPVHVKSMTDIDKAYQAYSRGQESCYIIITKEKARDGYMKRPSVIWNERRSSFICPHCYETIMMDVFDDGVKYKEPADHFYFQKENSKNRQCAKCGSMLWTALVPGQQSPWVKISNYGFVHRLFVRSNLRAIKTKTIIAYLNRKMHKTLDVAEVETDNTAHEQAPNDEILSLEENNNDESKNIILFCPPGQDIPVPVDLDKVNFPKVYYDLEAVAENPNGVFKAAGAYSRFALSTYIKKKLRGRIDGLIVDELQDYNNKSGQGDAMNELFGTAKKAIALTGTLINGYSQGVFYLLYRVAPHLMQVDDKAYNKTSDFNFEYGVTESVYKQDEPGYNSNRRVQKRKLREKQLPGVSPLVYSRFLIVFAVFLSLNNMGKHLPDYEEIPVELELDSEVWDVYRQIEDIYIDILKFQKNIAQKVMSKFNNLLTAYPDQPYKQEQILNPMTGALLIKPKDVGSIKDLNAKDKWLLDKVKEKILAGEKVIVYTSWVRLDTQEKLLKLFKAHNIYAEVLSSMVEPSKREEWVEKRVQKGVKVIITNPQLMETGLDLNDFPTLIYYNISYKLFTLRQSSRRSWRINQTAPRVEVYFLYFKNVIQHRAVRLMASKLAVAGVIEGNFTDEGLAAMSECQDLTTLLAQELTLGIKNDVEDLSQVFKKMAIINPKKAVTETRPDHMAKPDITENHKAPVVESKDIILPNYPTPILTLKSGPTYAEQCSSQDKKANKNVLQSQISLFDFVEVSA